MIRRFAAGPIAASVIAAMTLCASAAQPPPGEPGDAGTFVLLFADHLAEAAEQWCIYRSAQGWQIAAHPVAPSPDEPALRAALQVRIREAWRDHNAAATQTSFAVLILGDVPDAAGEPGVPTWRFRQTDPSMRLRRSDEYVSDHPYQLADDADDKPDFPLGRVPARTNDEARAVVDKIRRHEAAPLDSPGRNRIVYAAGEGHFGPMDGVLESLFITMIDRFVPPAYDISMTYAKASSIYCPPPSRLTETVLERLAEPALLFNYIGHGFERGFDSLHWRGQRLPILDVRDLDRLTAPPDDSGARSLAFLSCCSVGWFDLPGGERSLGEAMLFHPAGPVAVIAGSRVTHPYANTVLQMDITRALLGSEAVGSGQLAAGGGEMNASLPPPLPSGGRGRAGVGAEPQESNARPRTVGDVDLIAGRSLVTADPVDRELDLIASPIARAGGWTTSLGDLRRMHVKLYNLLGDPATIIASPAAPIEELKLGDGIVSGRIEGMTSGRVQLVIETERASMAQATALQMPTGSDDPDLERKAANNYPLVNDRVLARLQGEIRDGAFSITLPEPLPENAALIRVSAIGASANGEPLTTIGALRLSRPLASGP